MKFFKVFIIVLLLLGGWLSYFYNGLRYIRDKPIIVNTTDTIFVMNVTCYKVTNNKVWNNKTAWMKPTVRINPISSRVVALPREMLKNKCGLKNYNKDAPFSFGDSVELTGKDFIYQGKYIVGETTAKNIHNSIDIEVGKNNRIGAWKGIFIKKIRKKLVIS